MLTLKSHKQRKALGLSLNEMAVLVEIHKSIYYDPLKKPFATISKSKLSDMLDLSQKSIFNILNKLESMGYINRLDENGYIQITDKVYNTDY
jgi:DNA-binding MarR family transcriptional regulator